MIVSYEIAGTQGKTNCYFLTNPSSAQTSEVELMLLRENFNGMLHNLYQNQTGLNGYIKKILPKLENPVFAEILFKYLNQNAFAITMLRKEISIKHIQTESTHESNTEPSHKTSSKHGWKQEFTYARNIESMSGYFLTFFSQAESLCAELGYQTILQNLKILRSNTQELLNAVSENSRKFIINKFIH